MDRINEDTQGCRHCVDNSQTILEQGGTCPSPPGTLTVPPSGPRTLRGVGDVPPAPKVKVGVGTPPCYVHPTANLDADLNVIPLYPPSKCKLKYIVIECACGRRVVPSVCMSLDCDTCRPHVGRRRANSVLKRLMGSTLYQRRRNHYKTVIYSIFTVPMELREGFLEANEWQKARKKAWRILKEHFGARFGLEATHPRGDSSTTLFHPHLNFLWVQEEGWRPFLDVELLRELWAEALGVPTVDVFTKYSNSLYKIIDWADYVTRSFPGNHKWTGPMRWYGKYPRIKEIVECRCNECGSRFRVIGWLLASDVDEWLEKGWATGIDPPWKRDHCINPMPRRKKNFPCREDS